MNYATLCVRPIKMWAIRRHKGPLKGYILQQGYKLPRLYSTRSEALESMRIWHLDEREWKPYPVKVSVTW